MKIAILISGRGSNMRSLVSAAHDSDTEIVLIAANQPCAGLDFAQEQQLPSCLINKADFPNKTAHENALAAAIEKAQADWIFLAGYMAILSAEFIARFDAKIINIHPSLLPAFKGLNTHQRAIQAGEKVHGVSIHLVTADLDDGPLIAQAQLEIKTNNPDELAAQVLQIEHLLYPAILAALASDKLHLNPEKTDQKVSWKDTSILPLAGTSLITQIDTF